MLSSFFRRKRKWEVVSPGSGMHRHYQVSLENTAVGQAVTLDLRISPRSRKGAEAMRHTVYLIFCFILALAPAGLAQPLGTVEEELAKVRDAGKELYTRESSVFGKLPGPAEMADQQLRSRPTPIPKAGVKHEMTFDVATRKRAAGLDPMKLRKAPGRMGMTVLPLGITGAYVVEAQKRLELLVVHVLDDTPAAGTLQVDDILIGANGRLFADDEDPRPEMGNALCESQSKELGGILTLQIVRGGKAINVKLDLGSTLDFGPGWPYDCEKTKRVRRDALRFVMDDYPWHRYDFWTPMFLLASGDEAALELARRHLCSGIQREYEPGTGGSAWVGGYRLTSLCEYYLLTGDSAVLPLIRNVAEGLAWAQYRSGSWSHGGGRGPTVPTPGTAGGGYGEVNNAGLGALIGLCLARQCGIEPFKRTIPRSIRFFGPFCGENLGYGLGTPSDSRTGRMDNGMNGMSALVFHLLGEREMARRWARSVCYMWMGRERGHAEAIFSAAWGPVSADLAPRPEFNMFMNQMKWAYEMGRARDGSLNYMRGSRWTLPNMTAAYGLFLYLPEKRLQVLGGDSVFAQKPPEKLAKAAELYKRKKWKELTTFLDAQIQAGGLSADETTYAKKLLEAYRRMEKHAAATLEIIEENVVKGDLQTARVQLDLLARFVGSERPAAAKLRAKLATAKAKAARKTKAPPLINSGEIMKKLGLAKGGIRDGWAHSPDYINATNQRGFEGMTPEQIASFLGHFAGGPAGGSVRALAGHGRKVAPLLKRLLADKHPGVRAGAVETLRLVYASDVKEYRTEVPDELAGIIKLIRPMLDDESKLVRSAVSGLVISLKVVNEDIYAMVHKLALQGAGVHNFVRHGVKDPKVRLRLAMAIIDGNNKRRVQSPGSYIPMICATTSHIDLCEPYIKTAVDTVKNPEVQIMYGFFSNHPEDASLHIFDRFHEHPLVMENMPLIIRISFLRGQGNAYWDVHKEYAHRIAIKLGPKALPAIDKFWTDTKKLIDGVAAGKQKEPHWWKADLPDRFEENRREWQDTAELIRCLYGMKPDKEAVTAIVRHCLMDRWWAAWERALIWDKLIEMGPAVLPQLRNCMATGPKSALEGIDKRIAENETALQATKDRKEQGKYKKAIAELTKSRSALGRRVGQLEALMSLIEHLTPPKPAAEHVRHLCGFYLRRSFGAQYPYIKEGDTSYIRPLHARQDRQVRDKLTRWGASALPEIRRFIEDDKKALAGLRKKLDEEEAFWKPQWSRKSSGPLARIANERVVIVRVRQELQDLADLIGLTSKKTSLDKAQLATLCRIYTRNDWPLQREVIRDTLKRNRPAVDEIIRQHTQDEQTALAEADANVSRLMGNTVRDSVKLSYDYWRNLARTTRQGNQELSGLLKK